MDTIQDPQYKTPDGSALRIWKDAAKNNFLSEREGRALYDEVVLVEVISPGSRDSTPVFECVRNFCPEANQSAPLYGIKYDEFKSYILDFEKSETSDASMSGTPLSQWPEMTRTMVAALKAQNIFTVDALAALPDTKLIVVGPDGRTWREKAKAYIENAKGGAYATALAADLDRAKADLVASQAQVAELAEAVKTLQAAKDGTAPPAAPPPTQVAEPAPAPAPAPSPEAPELDPITGLPSVAASALAASATPAPII